MCGIFAVFFTPQSTTTCNTTTYKKAFDLLKKRGPEQEVLKAKLALMQDRIDLDLLEQFRGLLKFSIAFLKPKILALEIFLVDYMKK